MQNAESMADMIFTHNATCVGSLVNCVKKLPVSMKKGAPGGCPTSNFEAVVINSGQSQKLAVGSTVMQYVHAAIAKANQPIRSFTKRYCFIESVKLSKCILRS